MKLRSSSLRSSGNKSLDGKVFDLFRKHNCTVLGAGAATPVLGPELVTNGDFSNGTTGWAVPVGWGVASGIASGTATSTSLVSIGATSSGKSYLVEFDVTYTSGTLYAAVGANYAGQVSFATSGHKAIVLISGATATRTVEFYGGSFTGSVDNVTVKEILGYTYGNPPARNFFDSAGTDILDSVTQVDQPVGLVLDAAGTVGPELVTASMPITSVAIGGPSYTEYATGVSVVSGQSYQLTMTVANYVGSGTFGWAGGVFGPHIEPSSNTTVTQIMKATGTGALKVFSRSTNSGTLTLSVKEITGNHATQPTTGSKPTLRRGLVNQLLYSSISPSIPGSYGFGNNGTGVQPVITTNYGTAPNGLSTAPRAQLNLNGGTATADRSYVSGAATPTDNTVRTLAVTLRALSGTPTVTTRLQGSSVYTTLSAEWQLVVVSGSSGTDPTCNLVEIRGGQGTPNSNTADVLIGGAGLFSGTVTAQQIIDAGGIPLTTTAPASSNLGKYWWQFDPTAPGDFFNMAAPMWSGTDDHCVVVGMTAGAPGGNNRTLFSQHDFSTTNTSFVPLVGVSGATGHARFSWRNSSGTEFSVVSLSSVVGLPTVLSARRIGSAGKSRVNGVALAEVTLAGTFNVQEAAIGFTRWSNTVTDFFNGGASVIVLMKATVSDADLALIERWVGSLQGQTL